MDLNFKKWLAISDVVEVVEHGEFSSVALPIWKIV